MNQKDNLDNIIDLRKYIEDNKNAEKYIGDSPDDLLRALWIVMLAFAELGFGLDPSQSTRNVRNTVCPHANETVEKKAA